MDKDSFKHSKWYLDKDKIHQSLEMDNSGTLARDLLNKAILIKIMEIIMDFNINDIEIEINIHVSFLNFDNAVSTDLIFIWFFTFWISDDI